MGLDAWLMAKTKARQITDKNSATGVCSGIFGIVPTVVSKDIELCYLRKAYDQRQLLYSCGFTKDKDEEYTWHFTKADLRAMLKEARRILSTHDFDSDDEGDITPTEKDPNFISESYTFSSKTKWKNLINGLKEALEILKEDQEADIYYHEWF